MKTRIKLLILMLLFAGSSVMAQKEVRQGSLKIYLPVQFNAGNYQVGTYTWGRWYSPGIEVGLNLKKKRFEQEFILGSPKTYSTTNLYERYSDSGTKYYINKDWIQTTASFGYQAGYCAFTSKSGKFNIVPGLGLAIETSFAKVVSYEEGTGEIEYKLQTGGFSPYLFTSLRYALNAKWSIEGSVMFRPYSAMYWRLKGFDNGKTHHIDTTWFVSEHGITMIYSRFGVGYTF